MFNYNINGTELTFDNPENIFCPSSIDKGTLAMLSKTEFKENDKILDLGCGCGVVGILASRLVSPKSVIMTDVSCEAIEASRNNAILNGFEPDNNFPDIRLSDGFSNIPERDFTLILSNPPYHTDFSVAKGFIENGYKALVTGGRMYMVTKRLDWYKNKLTSVFGGVKVFNEDGYYIFVAEKREKSVHKNKKNISASADKQKQNMSKKLARKYSKK